MRAIFQKYEAAANDFILIDSTEEYSRGEGAAFVRAWRERAPELCRRRTGIGADGIILVSRLPQDAYDIHIDIINADGSIAEMCGNGIRCVARFLSDASGLADGAWRIDTLGGIQFVRIRQTADDFPIEVAMARVSIGNEMTLMAKDGRRFHGFFVDTGNPHFVIQCGADEDPYLLARQYGGEFCTSDRFSEGANIEFTRHRDGKNIQMSVYERGCGITLACGTGAVASGAVWAGALHLPRITILAEGGQLRIRCQSTDRCVLCGNARRTFCGTIEP